MASRETVLRPAITAVLAEDEPALREEMAARLQHLWPELQIVASVGSGVEALAAFQQHQPRIMFLDIQMPGLTGLEVARQVAERCHLVFITAYDAHAVSAFENGAVDYLLKPYDVERLVQTIRRLQQRLVAPPPALTGLLNELAAAVQPRAYLNWIRASQGHEVKLITVRDVCYFRADTKYTSVVTATEEYIIRRSIKDLAAELDPAQFLQIHRATIINLEAISSISRNIAGEMSVRLKARPERLAVSETNRHLFRHM
jgi:DNA-binding LytR/AlgR family response regulator